MGSIEQTAPYNSLRTPSLLPKLRHLHTYGHSVKIDGHCEVVYRPDKPLSCGAHVWIETTGVVEVDGKIVNQKLERN